jgi:hypothetical protein
VIDEYGVDLDEVLQVIDSADVLVVRLHLVQERLLVDFRAKPGIPPLLAVVPRAESVEDRFRSIKKLRPEFPFPEKVMSFHWPRTMPVMLASGVWQHIVDRVSDIGGIETKEACGKIMETLLAKEHEEVEQAISGSEHYQTLWERE